MISHEDAWPASVLDESFEYTVEHAQALACADGLVAWANCMMGRTPPKNFGMAMVKIGKVLGIVPSPDNLSRYCDEKILKKEAA